MAYSLKENLMKEDRLAGGHRMCAGCGSPIAVRTILRALEPEDKAVVCSATSCLEVSTFMYPYTEWKVRFIHNAFEMFDFDGKFGASALDAYEMLDFDSVTHYNMGTRKERDNDYSEIIKIHKKGYDEMDERGIKYFPQVSLGWDANPRFREFQPYIMTNNTPENIKKALIQAKEYIDTHNLPAPLITINSWNEWTETSYLQPDNVYGYGYLEAIKKVFKD